MVRRTAPSRGIRTINRNHPHAILWEALRPAGHQLEAHLALPNNYQPRPKRSRNAEVTEAVPDIAFSEEGEVSLGRYLIDTQAHSSTTRSSRSEVWQSCRNATRCMILPQSCAAVDGKIATWRIAAARAFQPKDHQNKVRYLIERMPPYRYG